MKGVFSALLVLLASVTLSQAQEQSGIPAKLTVKGRQVPVYLQGMDGDKITFQLNRKPNNQSAPAQVITKIDFLGRYDVQAMEQQFNEGDYQGLIDTLASVLKPSLDDYLQYMVIENNLQDVFAMLMKAHLRLGNSAKAQELSKVLIQNPDTSIQAQSESIGLLAALGENDIAAAEALLGKIDSEAGKLYLGASIERAKGNYAAAHIMVVDLIAEYPNDLDWMPQAELLSARLYMDVGRTNSAINTARQVKVIYANSNTGNDAAKLHAQYLDAQKRAAEAAQAKADEAAAKRAEIAAKAEERAKGFGFDAKEDDETEDAETGTTPATDGGSDAGSDADK